MIDINPEQRAKIARQICAEIRESEGEKERLVERWKRLRAIHDCEESTSQVQLIEGMKPYMLPLSRTKGDRIVGAVTDGITGINPYVQVFDEGNLNTNLDDVEKDLMTLAADAGDVEAIREGTEDAFLTNCGVWRVRPLIDEKTYDVPSTEGAQAPVTRIDWEALDPVDVCCYPPYYGSFSEAKTVGHRWSELLYRVRRQMEDGMYEKYDLKGGDDPLRRHGDDDGRLGKYQPQELTDRFVELWQVITELDLEGKGEYKKYLCVVAITDEKLLSIQDYPYSTAWYVAVRTSRERKRIWPNSSIAQRLQGLQLAYSDAFTAGIQASYCSLGPITILTGGGLMSKVQQLKPFMMIESPVDVKVQTIASNPQVGILPQSIEKIEEVADALTGISRNGVGQQLPSDTTAHEVEALQQAQAEAKDQYTQAIAGSVESVFGLIFEYYQIHYADLKRAYGDKLVADGNFIQTVKPQLKVNGKNGSSSSALVLQKLQMLLGWIANIPNTNFDPSKIVEVGAQMLDFPFSLERLEKDPNPLDPILQNPDVQRLLMSGEPLTMILQTLQNASAQPGSPGVVPQLGMGGDAGAPGGNAGAGAPTVFPSGGGNPSSAGAGQMPGA